jgi:hypothetical protein
MWISSSSPPEAIAAECSHPSCSRTFRPAAYQRHDVRMPFGRTLVSQQVRQPDPLDPGRWVQPSSRHSRTVPPPNYQRPVPVEVPL